jgi:hypothetical protein
LNLSFKTAESDIGGRIPWGHLISSEESLIRIKAVLVDEHGGQIAGLGKYFEKEYPFHNRQWHISRIVKVCRVHYNRSINRLMAHVDASKSREMNRLTIEICTTLRMIPELVISEHVDNVIAKARAFAESTNNETLRNWIKHKDANPWVLTCLTLALSQMSRSDWFSTSVDTNIAESAHAQSQRDGVKLTLVTAVKKGERKDSLIFGLEEAALSGGIAAKYGNRSISGRTRQNLTRAQARQRKRQEKGKDQSESTETMRFATEMVQRGIAPSAVEGFLLSQRKL